MLRARSTIVLILGVTLLAACSGSSGPTTSVAETAPATTGGVPGDGATTTTTVADEGPELPVMGLITFAIQLDDGRVRFDVMIEDWCVPQPGQPADPDCRPSTSVINASSPPVPGVFHLLVSGEAEPVEVSAEEFASYMAGLQTTQAYIPRDPARNRFVVEFIPGGGRDGPAERIAIRVTQIG